MQRLANVVLYNIKLCFFNLFERLFRYYNFSFSTTIIVIMLFTTFRVIYFTNIINFTKLNNFDNSKKLIFLEIITTLLIKTRLLSLSFKDIAYFFLISFYVFSRAIFFSRILISIALILIALIVIAFLILLSIFSF